MNDRHAFSSELKAQKQTVSAALGGTVCSSCTQLRAPENRGPGLSVGGTWCLLPSWLELTGPSTGSPCAGLGQRPRLGERHMMSPVAPGDKISFLTVQPSVGCLSPSAFGTPQPSSPSVLARPPSITWIWLWFRNHLEETHSLYSSGVYQPSQRRCQRLRTRDRLCSL